MDGNTHSMVEKLHEAISSEDKKRVVEELESILAALQAKNPELASVIIHPPVITELHNRLVEVFQVPRRAMMLRNRVPGRDSRAILFTKAMLNGMKRVM